MTQKLLLAAIKASNLTEVEKILQTGISSDEFEGESCIFQCAIQSGHSGIVQALIDAKASIHSKEKFLPSPLGYAIMHDKLEIVQLLVAAGADYNESDGFIQTPLFNAVSDGHSKIVQFLLEKGATVDSVNHCGDTPLKRAIVNRRTECVQLLLKAKASIEKCTFRYGVSPLQFVLEQNNFDIAHLLVDAGHSLDVPISTNSPKTLILHEFAGKGNFDQVRFLIDAKASLDRLDSLSYTPLGIAVVKGYYDIVELLVEKKASLDTANFNRTTPLIRAIDRRFVRIARLLIKTGANLETLDKHNRTPLMYAVSYNQPEIVEILLKKGAWLNSHNTWNESPWSLLRSYHTGCSPGHRLEYQHLGKREDMDRMRRIILSRSSLCNWNWHPRFHRLTSKSVQEIVSMIMIIWSRRVSFCLDDVALEILFHIFNFLV